MHRSEARSEKGAQAGASGRGKMRDGGWGCAADFVVGREMKIFAAGSNFAAGGLKSDAEYGII